MVGRFKYLVKLLLNQPLQRLERLSMQVLVILLENFSFTKRPKILKMEIITFIFNYETKTSLSQLSNV